MKNVVNRGDARIKLNRFLKTVGVALVLIIAYAISVYTKSFSETNLLLLKLVIYSLCGFVGFYAVYFIAYLITLIIYNKRVKKIAKTVISCDDNVAMLFDGGKNTFKYDVKKDFKSNVNEYKNTALNVVDEVATGYGINKGNFYYLNFTVYDAIDVVRNAVDGVDNKISPIFRFLHAEDKPLIMVENLLISAIESEKEPKIEDENKKPSVLSSLINKAKMAGAFVLKGAIENAFNELLVFLSYEAFKVYGKDGKTYLPKTEGGDENA